MEEASQLVLTKTYSASDWLFIDKISALVDGQRFEVQEIEDQVRRETTPDGVRETYITEVDGNVEDMVRAITQADDAEVRLGGRSTSRDVEVSEREKRAMRNVLALYDQLTSPSSQ